MRLHGVRAGRRTWAQGARPDVSTHDSQDHRRRETYSRNAASARKRGETFDLDDLRSTTKSKTPCSHCADESRSNTVRDADYSGRGMRERGRALWKAASDARASSWRKNCQLACKPGSVRQSYPCAMAIHLGRGLRRASCNQPGRQPGNRLEALRLTSGLPLRRYTGFRPPLFGLAPGGVYRATPVARSAVRSYRTLSPLPRAAPCSRRTWRDRRFAFCCTFPEVTLAGRYPAPCLHGARTFLHQRRFPLRQRPSSQLAGAIRGARPLASMGTVEQAPRRDYLSTTKRALMTSPW